MRVKNTDTLGIAELKWCKEAEGRSDKSLLNTLAKLKADPDTIVRDYHWVMYNEMCYRGIQDNEVPKAVIVKKENGKSKVKVVNTGSVVKTEKIAVKKDFGPDWIEGRHVRLTREYGGQHGVEGTITHIWNEGFPHDFEIRIKPYDKANPMKGLLLVNKSELMLLNVKKDYVPKYYVPTKKAEIDMPDLRFVTDGKKAKRKNNNIRV